MSDLNSSWLKDGVAEIERVVTQGVVTTPQIIELPKEKVGTYAVVTPGPSGQSKMEVKVAGPKWHRELLDSPKELISFINSLEERGDDKSEGAVYVSETGITFVYDFDDRRDRAVCPLVKTKPWQWLSAAQQPMDQRSIIRLLRITFDGCLPGDSNLISVLRNVKWKSDGTAEGQIARGKEALGRSIINEVTGITNFPEEFTLSVPVFENHPATVLVRVALEILPDVQKFEVIPFPQQVVNGVARVLDGLVAAINEETSVPTFIGSDSDRGE